MKKKNPQKKNESYSQSSTKKIPSSIKRHEKHSDKIRLTGWLVGVGKTRRVLKNWQYIEERAGAVEGESLNLFWMCPRPHLSWPIWPAGRSRRFIHASRAEYIPTRLKIIPVNPGNEALRTMWIKFSALPSLELDSPRSEKKLWWLTIKSIYRNDQSFRLGIKTLPKVRPGKCKCRKSELNFKFSRMLPNRNLTNQVDEFINRIFLLSLIEQRMKKKFTNWCDDFLH